LDNHKEPLQTAPWRYAMGTLGGSLPFNMFTTFTAFYYVNMLNLDIRIFSLVLLFYSFFDAIDNPLYGYLSDRTRTRFGRRKPWLLVASTIFGLSFIAFFSPPAFLQERGFIIYFVVMMILVETSMSAIQSNYNALLPDLFREKDPRTKANSLRTMWMLIATVVGVALAPVITEAIGFPLTALIFGIVSISVWYFVVLGCKESRDYENYQSPQFFRSIKEIAMGKQFWIIAIVACMYSAAQMLMMAGIPFFVEYSLGLGAMNTTIMLGVVIGMAILSLPVWFNAIKRFSLIPMWRLALAVLTVAFVPMFFASTMPLAIVGGIFIGIGTGGVMSTQDLVVAGLLDADREKYGQRREGIYQSIVGFFVRLSGLFRSVAFFLVFALFGFESGENPGANPAGASRFLLVIVPISLMTIGVIISSFMQKIKEREV